jgi:hypothetical protein
MGNFEGWGGEATLSFKIALSRKKEKWAAVQNTAQPVSLFYVYQIRGLFSLDHQPVAGGAPPNRGLSQRFPMGYMRNISYLGVMG